MLLHGAMLFAAPSFAGAATLVNSGLDGGSSGPLGATGKAVVFSTSTQAYTLDSATVRLNLPSTTSATHLNASLYAGTFTEFSSWRPAGAPLVTFTFPTIETTGVQNVTLVPSTPYTLAANTVYFFVIWGSGSATGVSWSYNTDAPASETGFTFPDVRTTTGVQYGWFNGSGNTLSDPTTWTSDTGVYNDFQLQGTLIPEPSSAVLLSSLGVLGLVRRRR